MIQSKKRFSTNRVFLYVYCFNEIYDMGGFPLVKLFDDKRQTTCVMMTWLLIVMVCYDKSEPVGGSSFLKYGPSNTTVIMGVHVDTWPKWGGVIAFSFVNTCMNEFISNSIDPWILNTIQDDKTKSIPYSKMECVVITQLYNIYCHMMSVVGISLLMSQIDVLGVRIFADLIVSTFAMRRFVRDKVVLREEGSPSYTHVVQEMREKCPCEKEVDREP